MIGEKLNPLLFPVTKRPYLYDKILLQWEIHKNVLREENFNGKKILAECGINVVSVTTADELTSKETEAISTDFIKAGYLYFFNKGNKYVPAGYPCLMKRLRDTVAHGDYSSPAKGWMTIRHVYNGKIHIFGQIEIDRLRMLVDFMNTSI